MGFKFYKIKNFKICDLEEMVLNAKEKRQAPGRFREGVVFQPMEWGPHSLCYKKRPGNLCKR